MAGLSPLGWRGAHGAKQEPVAARKTKEKGFAFGGGLQDVEPGLPGQLGALLPPCPPLSGSRPRPCHRGCVPGTAALLQLCHLLRASSGMARPVLTNK